MKILVVDDHVLIREALAGVLVELHPAALVVHAASSASAMEKIGAESDLDLVLIDLKLPDRDGLELLADLRARFPGIATVVLSASDDRGDIARALDLGALGFIPKSASREVFLGALRLILAGGVYVPPEILRTPNREGPTGVDPVPAVASPNLSAAPPLALTERQMEVLALMMLGKSNKGICRALDLAEPTVKNHVSAILRALKAANRTEAVIAAAALGVSADGGNGSARPSPPGPSRFA